MPRLILCCDTCDSRWDGGMLSEYPNLRICNECVWLASIRLTDLMGWEFIKEILQSPNQHFISMLCNDGHYPTRTGSTWVGIEGAYAYVSRLDDPPPNPALPPVGDSSRYIRDTGDTGDSSSEGRGVQSSSLAQESPVEATAGDEES